IPGGMMKALLKKLAEKYIPYECIYRTKQGFAAPMEAWLKGPLREQVYDLLNPSCVRQRGVFQVDFIEWVKREFYEEGRDLSLQLYQAVMLETWFKLFVDKKGLKYAGATLT
ncbi:MAG: asparagine synthase-related protein, partial [Planctomycetota bacterium]